MVTCYGCEHCGCDPADPLDSCWTCDRCTHDEKCESEFVIEAGAWTPCGCEERAVS